MITPKDYLVQQLSALAKSRAPEVEKVDLVEAIFKLVMSKKFRKYSAHESLKDHIREAIRINVAANKPINITFFNGGYKLWRLDEFPESDWAELFSFIYYTNWVVPICDIYKPGVWFDFFMDDLIVPKLDNIDLQDVEDYIASCQKIIDFLKPHQPQNLKMTITKVGDQFESEEAFDKSLSKNLEKITTETPGGLPVLTDEQKAMVELNTRVTKEQSKDPKWREKVYHLHNAYGPTKAEPGYHKNRPEKILAFTHPLPSGTTISVGTTKDSIAKFWVGVGALKPKDDSYRQIILTPSQLEKADFTFQEIEIDGLSGKNFHKIRILKD